MVVFDTATLILSFFPPADPPVDPETGEALTQAKARVDHLIDKLNGSGNTIVVPTPVLTELLAGAGDTKDEFLKAFHKGNRFKVEAFDERAALELALMLEEWKPAGKPRDVNETAAKVKFDRQIAAIAKANAADTLYTDDRKLKGFAEKHGINVVLTWELPLPPPEPEITHRPMDTKTGNLDFGSW